MTLDTRVYLHDPADMRAVFVKCCQLIGATEATRCIDRGAMMGTEPGQGLPAWLTVWRDMDGYPVVVSFDTGYGYQGPEGGCGGLHARLVRELGAWLDGQRVRWAWRNEWTGDVHQGTDGLETLGE